RLLNLVDESRQRTRTPTRKETLSDQRRTAAAVQRVAVTLGALGLVDLLAARGLRCGIDAFGDRARLGSFPDNDEICSRQHIDAACHPENGAEHHRTSWHQAHY